MSTQHWKTPQFIIHKTKEYALKGLTEILQRNLGRSVLSANWDHLIILDDCRYDVFEMEFKRRNLPGSLEKWISLGSWTGEFLVKNFGGDYHGDIVFVSANPFTDKYLKGKFYRLISVWKTHWNEKYNTVPPHAVYEAAVKAVKKYPEKKLVVHFLQPHHPYFALNFHDTGMRSIKDTIEKKNPHRIEFPPEPLGEIYLSTIYAYFPIQRLIMAYTENLMIVMPYVELLLRQLRGKSIVTSDHGELFGEIVTKILPIKVYGHGIGRNPNLITVPWWIVNDKDREKLPTIKELKKEITLIESKFGMKKKNLEELRLKHAISRLKIKNH